MGTFKELAKELSNDDTVFVSAREGGKVVDWVSTGNYALNWAISNRFNRGYPLGHVVEIFGVESTGKSLLMARAISEFQKAFGDGWTFLDDTENAFNPDWAERSLGVDVDRLQLTGSVTISEHFEAVKRILHKAREKEKHVFIGLDSLALLMDEYEDTNEFVKDRPGSKAKEIRKLFRKTRPLVKGLPAMYMTTNHETTKIGGWGSPTTTTGGTGSRYQSSVRINLRKPKKIKKGSDIVGVMVRPHIEKTRFTTPFRETNLVIPFNASISKTSGLIPVLLELGILKVKGRTLVYEGEDTGIYAQKTNPVKQDASSAELLEKFPALLEKADKMLEEQEAEASMDAGVNEEADISEEED